jgi:hypothetical protein
MCQLIFQHGERILLCGAPRKRQPLLLKSESWRSATILYLPQREYINSCVYAIEGIKLEDIPVVYEYPDVFTDDLPGMPPDRDIEFIIELQSGTALSLKDPIVCHPMSWQN